MRLHTDRLGFLRRGGVLGFTPDFVISSSVMLSIILPQQHRVNGTFVRSIPNRDCRTNACVAPNRQPQTLADLANEIDRLVD